ncbi:Ribonuclease 3-like protein 1 [Arabidopsis thaliana]
MEDQETKRITKKPSRSIIISLKDIPPLDPSSIPSMKPMPQDHHNVGMQRFQEKTDFKFEEEDNAISSFSNIQIDPNSTRSISLEKTLAPKPDEEHTTTTKPISKDDESKTRRGSAKSVLHEMCASKRWRPPVYECCNVDGPCHLRLDSSGKTVLECFGDPRRKKKAAAEHAAEGALWYLEHVKTKPHQ